jgi:hypothetical protein
MTRQTDTYTATEAIDAPPGAAWERLTDPFRFPSLFPNWVTAIDAGGGGGGPYTATGADDETFALVVETDREFGVIDYRVGGDDDPGGGTRRGRLVPAGDGCAFVTTIARRGDESAGEWETRKRKLDVDLAAARRMVDADADAGAGAGAGTGTGETGAPIGEGGAGN